MTHNQATEHPQLHAGVGLGNDKLACKALQRTTHQARDNAYQLTHLLTHFFVLPVNIEHPQISASREFPPSTSPRCLWTVCHTRIWVKMVTHNPTPQPMAPQLPSQNQQIPVTSDHEHSTMSSHSSSKPPALFSPKHQVLCCFHAPPNRPPICSH